MIERYSRPEMSALWSDRARFDLWLAVELEVCEAWARRGAIPQESMAAIRSRAGYDTARIAEIEAEVRHDVIAFLTSVAEKVGPDSRFIHMGMTSSDLLDTAFAIQLRRAGLRIADGVARLRSVIERLAHDHKYTIMMGRSHGIHAEPITFGLKAAVWHEEFVRHAARLADAVETVSAGKLSGAVGTFAHIEPDIESEVCAKFDLKPEPASTQIVQRDRHAHFFCVLACIAASIEKVAVEIRHLQRTEVAEAAEPFGRGQKGSSAMPHKRNPILCENLTGLARVVRANAMAALENVALWHERDISHSSVERVIAPDSTVLVDFMLDRLAGVLSGLVVDAGRMKRNMDVSLGLYNSQEVMLALVREGVTREEAYKAVQDSATKSWEEQRQFMDVLLEDKFIKQRISAEGLARLFDPEQHARHVDAIFGRVFAKERKS